MSDSGFELNDLERWWVERQDDVNRAPIIMGLEQMTPERRALFNKTLNARKATAEGKETLVAQVYLHIDNGGFTIGIEDDPEFGPTLFTRSMHFGHTANKTRIYVNQDCIDSLVEMFEKVKAHKFTSEPYCFAATILE